MIYHIIVESKKHKLDSRKGHPLKENISKIISRRDDERDKKSENR